MHARLTIDTAAIAANWRDMAARMQRPNAAAVVKADGYGLGAIPVSKALAAAGCAEFFVATLEEGLALRPHLPKSATLYILHGPQSPQEAAEMAAHNLQPVINTPRQLADWDQAAPFALHVDTGMNRLGFPPDEAIAHAACRPALLMTHLACAAEPGHPLNAAQRDCFRYVASHFPGTPTSIAASAGLLLDPAYHGDLSRIGCALYGIHPAPGFGECPVQGVATLEAPILQLRSLRRPEPVSYGASRTMPAGTVLATVGCGYADGWLRALTNTPSLSGWLDGHACMPVGRVTMDMLIFDVTHVPEPQRQPGRWMQLIGPHQEVNAVAEAAGTIGYEIFTRLGPRLTRRLAS